MNVKSFGVIVLIMNFSMAFAGENLVVKSFEEKVGDKRLYLQSPEPSDESDRLCFRYVNVRLVDEESTVKFYMQSDVELPVRKDKNKATLRKICKEKNSRAFRGEVCDQILQETSKDGKSVSFKYVTSSEGIDDDLGAVKAEKQKQELKLTSKGEFIRSFKDFRGDARECIYSSKLPKPVVETGRSCSCTEDNYSGDSLEVTMTYSDGTHSNKILGNYYSFFDKCEREMKKNPECKFNPSR
jgi:hypothetical protein